MGNENKFICFLYGNMAGRLCLKLLTMPWISRQAGKVLDSRLSRPYISFFVKKHNIDLSVFYRIPVPFQSDRFHSSGLSYV